MLNSSCASSSFCRFLSNARARVNSLPVYLILGIASLQSLPAVAQVSISLQANDSAAIPGSQRTYYANITGTSNQTVDWSVTGGCSLSSATGTPVVVTAPAVGGTCTSSPTNTISFASPVSCHITATAVDTSNGVKSVSTTLPVCAPSVSLDVFPKTTVLYKGQHAVIQSDLRGSTTTGVTWSITSDPGGFASISGGTTNRHTIVSATEPGTYVLTATSVADPTKTASSTFYVTNNALPATGLADHTEPVDCTAVGSGVTYEVGPARAYTNLDTVPWNLLNPGDTVRIHNDDLTGSAPTTYHQHISLLATGAPSEPVRICGVADSHGTKPIIDGDGATSPANADWASGYIENLGVVLVYRASTKYDAVPDSNMNVLIEGLHIRNASPSYHYLAQSGGGPNPYNYSASCIGIYTGRDLMIRGNELENCSEGIFVNSQTPQGNIIYDLTVEGNYVHNWGLSGSYLDHGLYLQAIGVAVQFNYFGASVDGAQGNVIKSRSVLDFLRWNYISQPVTTTARAFDMVEPEAFNCYVIPFDFAAYETSPYGGNDCNAPNFDLRTETVTPDQIAANYEAYHSDYVYGNIMDDSGSQAGYIHYGYDQQTVNGPSTERRGGTLYYWNNTHLYRPANGFKAITEGAAPDQGHSYEFPVIESVNNIFGGNGTIFLPTASFWQVMNLDSNWMQSGFALPSENNLDSYMGGITASELATCNQWGKCNNSQGHLIYSLDNVPGPASSDLYTGTQAPFSFTTFAPASSIKGLAAQLPSAIADQPSNMEYLPASSTAIVRSDLTYLGALDGGTATASAGSSPPVVAVTSSAPQVVSGSRQTAVIGKWFIHPLVVKVLDSKTGKPLPGVKVNFNVQGTGASATLSGPYGVTNAYGTAYVSVHANAKASTTQYEVTAVVAGVPGQAVFLLQNTKATAGIVFSDVSRTYTGYPLALLATTNPAGLSVVLAYDGKSNPPTSVGQHTVAATIHDPNYQGTATTIFTIVPRP